MKPADTKRLHYYERQFLGVRDFQDEQAYHNTKRRRHNLGHHTWGIVTGLDLIEQPVEGGGDGVDVYLQPGMAIDGYGREIALLEPYQLDPFLFEEFTTPQHLAVWMTYKEELTQRPPAGYELCDGGDQFTRVCETFRVIIEPELPTHDPITIAGQAIKSDAPPSSSSGEPVIPPDESVPYQDFPDAENNFRWLIPLGKVNWDGGKLIEAAPERLVEGRQYIGNVTAEVLAPAVELKIRDRFIETLPPVSGESAAEPTLEGVAVEVVGSLQTDRLLTAKDDVQIHGGKLDFRDRSGNNNPPFTVRQQDPGGSAGVDLRIKIGEETAGENRLVIGSDDQDQVVIADNGDTMIDGNVTIQNEKNLLIDGGRLNLQELGKTVPDWALVVEGETLQFLEPDDSNRVAFEVLDTSGDLDNPAIRLQGEADATLSAQQLIDLTDGGDTTLHTHPGATTTQKGMVEIAGTTETGINGESGARLVIPANDPRLLTLTQKTDLTDGGLTTLHRHPNGILNNVVTRQLFADDNTVLSDVVFGTTQRVVAFIHIQAIDPRNDFDRGDGLFADIFQVNGSPLGGISSGGDHLGSPGDTSNLRPGVYTGLAQRITFRLRSTQNASVWAVGVVFFENP